MPLRGFLNASLTVIVLAVIAFIACALYFWPHAVRFFERHPAMSDAGNYLSAAGLSWVLMKGEDDAA